VPSHEHREELRHLFETEWRGWLRDGGLSTGFSWWTELRSPVLLSVAERDGVKVIVVESRGAGF
jgi:hypothetical protein